MWYECKVTQAGSANDGIVYISLQDQNKEFDLWFVADDIVKKEMLATALTAICTNNLVSVGLYSTKQYSTIANLYLHSS